jgi:hypothetical protein
MEDDLILGDEEEVVEEEDFGYSYPDYIHASIEVLTMLESGNPMTKEEVKMANRLKKMCLEMLEHSVKELHKSLFNS